MTGLAALLRARMIRGILQGSQLWLVVGGVYAGRKLLRRLKGDTDQVVFREVLPPGQAFVIANGMEPVSDR